MILQCIQVNKLMLEMSFVFCGKTPEKEKMDSYNGARLVYLPFNANGGQSIIYDVISIIKSWFKYDVLVILGTPGSIILPILMLFKKTKTNGLLIYHYKPKHLVYNH